MSRGLGKLQREILDNLERSKDGSVLDYYNGGGNTHAVGEWTMPGYVNHAGQRFTLDNDAYDLRAVKQVVADLAPRERYSHAQFYAPAYDVAFHRAAKSLITRGILEDCGPWGHDTGTGKKRKIGRQLRFVCLSDKYKDLALTRDTAEAAAS